MNGKISLQDGRHNDDNIVGNCVEKVNTELKNLSESREIEKMWNQFNFRVKIVSWKISNTVML